jgi:hypothetical protein
MAVVPSEPSQPDPARDHGEHGKHRVPLWISVLSVLAEIAFLFVPSRTDRGNAIPVSPLRADSFHDKVRNSLDGWMRNIRSRGAQALAANTPPTHGSG